MKMPLWILRANHKPVSTINRGIITHQESRIAAIFMEVIGAISVTGVIKNPKILLVLISLRKVCHLTSKNPYGRYNWVTPGENKRLVPFQKKGKFIVPEIAYEEAGVTILKIETEEFENLIKL